MAVNINSVYQTVLYILNKEQRGYITPDGFNSIANQVQEEILDSYFPNGNQFNRLNQNNSQNDTEFFNLYKDLNYKLYPFEEEVPFVYDTGHEFSLKAFVPESQYTLYKLGEVISNYNNIGQNQESVTQCVSFKDFNKIKRSKLTAPTKQYPLFYTTNALYYPTGATGTVDAATTSSNTATVTLTSGSILQNLTVSGQNIPNNTLVNGYDSQTKVMTFSKVLSLTLNQSLTFLQTPYETLVLKIFPNPDSLTVNGIVRPNSPFWAYSVGTAGQFVYSANGSVNFTLDVSERTNIITRILKYCGIILNDPTIIQVADQDVKQVEANEKS